MAWEGCIERLRQAGYTPAPSIAPLVDTETQTPPPADEQQDRLQFRAADKVTRASGASMLYNVGGRTSGSGRGQSLCRSLLSMRRRELLAVAQERLGLDGRSSGSGDNNGRTAGGAAVAAPFASLGLFGRGGGAGLSLPAFRRGGM
jgi:hypothetical protein